VVQPVELSVGARAVWAELAPVCLVMGTLTPADVRVFATLCELQSTLQRASASKDSCADADSLAGALKLERDTAAAVRPFYALFGLEPVSRARVAVKPDEQKVSKWAGVLA
jgi:phage terminase small subunit